MDFNFTYDAIILDFIMPIPRDWSLTMRLHSNLGLLTGFVLFKAIRSLFPKIPIIIYTASELTIKEDEYTKYFKKPAFNLDIIECLYKFWEPKVSILQQNVCSFIL